MNHAKALASWHSCERWTRYGGLCAFDKKEEKRKSEEPEHEDIATIQEAVASAAVSQGVGALRARAGAMAMAAEAEEVVTRAAEAIPLEGGNLREALSGKGAVGLAVGTAAGVAVQDVLKGIATRRYNRQYKVSGGGYVFESVFKAKEALRVR